MCMFTSSRGKSNLCHCKSVFQNDAFIDFRVVSLGSTPIKYGVCLLSSTINLRGTFRKRTQERYTAQT